ncbi:hypothetical protein [Paenarthrobacter sp. NPDC058040]|uniref:hypothetical protein n=1 Tax=unclassified Paenarthrobacter TaxID=2634190 RepID=UPI0036DC3291
MKPKLLAAAVAVMIGGAFAMIANPVVGATIGVSVFAGGLADLKRRQQVSSCGDAAP